nr:HPr family phosphocarrier protein [Neobacillus sp. Marseille-Q6967]
MKKQLKIVAVTGFVHPACLIVSGASKFTSTISLNYNGVSVNLKNWPNSIMELMSLRIKPGAYVEITANGCDELAALQTIENILSQNLYIETEKRGNSLTVSKELCTSCDEVVFRDEASWS